MQHASLEKLHGASGDPIYGNMGWEGGRALVNFGEGIPRKLFDAIINAIGSDNHEILYVTVEEKRSWVRAHMLISPRGFENLRTWVEAMEDRPSITPAPVSH